MFRNHPLFVAGLILLAVVILSSLNNKNTSETAQVDPRDSSATASSTIYESVSLTDDGPHSVKFPETDMQSVIHSLEGKSSVGIGPADGNGNSKSFTMDSANVYLELIHFRPAGGYDLLGRFVVRRDGTVIGWKPASGQNAESLTLQDFLEARATLITTNS